MVTGTLLAEDIDLFGLYDTKGALLWGALSEARLASFSVNPDELEVFLAQAMERLPRDEAPPTGIVAVAGRAAYYTVKPLIYEVYGAAVVGHLAMLRFIDATEIARWETLVGGILRVPLARPRQSAVIAVRRLWTSTWVGSSPIWKSRLCVLQA